MNLLSTIKSMQLNDLLTWCAVLLALTVLLAGVVFDLSRKKDSGLEAHLLRASAAGSIPTGMVLIRAGFDPSILLHLSGVNIYITFAGFALIYVSIKALTSVYERRKQPTSQPSEIKTAALPQQKIP